MNSNIKICYQNFKNNILAIFLFLIGIFLCLKAIKFGTDSFGDLLDGKFNSFILEHLYRHLIGKEESFFEPSFFYPLPNVLLLSDNHFFLGIIYSIFRIIGFDSASAFNLWVFFGLIANFWVCYYVLIRFGITRKSSAYGAFIFTFNQVILFKLSHIQLNFKIFIPLAILYSKLYFEKRNFKYIAYIILCITLQLACNNYNGSFLIFYIFIIFLYYLSQFQKDDFYKFLPQKYDLKPSIISLTFASIIFLIFALPYRETQKLYDLTAPASINNNFEIINLFIIPSTIWQKITTYFELQYKGNYAENSFFLGIGPWIAIIFFIFNKKLYKNLKEFDKILIKSTLFIIIFFTLDKYIGTFYFMQLSFPNYTNLRAFNRFFYVIFFGLIYLICLTLDNLKLKNKLHFALFTLIICTTIIESATMKIDNSNFRDDKLNGLYQYKKAITDNYQPNYEATLFLTSQKPFHYIVHNQISAMEASREYGLKTLNGYSSKLFLGHDYATNCNQIEQILQYKEGYVNHILTRKVTIDNSKKGIKTPENFSTNFKYDRKKILVFLDNKLCE